MYTYRTIIAALTFVGIGLIAWIDGKTSPTIDEVSHLPAGLMVWERGCFRAYKVNPPLVKAIASIPVFLARPRYDWTQFSDQPGARTEAAVGRSFIRANDSNSFRYFAMARVALLPIWILGTVTIACWTNQLYGRRSAVMATVLWVFSPNVIAWTATICPDVPAAVFGLLACYTFRSWIIRPLLVETVSLGCCLGLALITKTTWIILVPVFGSLMIACSVIERRARGSFTRASCLKNPLRTDRAYPTRQLPIEQCGTSLVHCLSYRFGSFMVVLFLCLYVINMAYGFDDSFCKVRELRFFSRALAGADMNGHLRNRRQVDQAANRFAEGPFGNVRVPLPAAFVEGVDLQKYDFEEKRWSYLRGEHKLGGWWYWYIYALAVKVPLGTWVIVVLALGSVVWRGCAIRGKSLVRVGVGASPGEQGAPPDLIANSPLRPLTEFLLVIVPAISVLVFVSAETGFSCYLRYVLPCFPFLFIAGSQVVARSTVKWLRIAAWCCLSGTITSSLSSFPHSMSYFNEFASGSECGAWHLIDANIDWGQDVFYLKQWLDSHPEATVKPIYVSLFTSFDISIAGIRYESPPVRVKTQAGGDSYHPPPGWYAISVQQLYNRYGSFGYLKKLVPVGYAGRSIWIYHIPIGSGSDSYAVGSAGT